MQLLKFTKLVKSRIKIKAEVCTQTQYSFCYTVLPTYSTYSQEIYWLVFIYILLYVKHLLSSQQPNWKDVCIYIQCRIFFLYSFDLVVEKHIYCICKLGGIITKWVSMIPLPNLRTRALPKQFISLYVLSLSVLFHVFPKLVTTSPNFVFILPLLFSN